MDLKEITRKDVKNTVFSVIESNINGECKIAIANSIVSKRTFKDETTTRKYINSKPWELIENMIALYVDYAIETKLKTIEMEQNQQKNKRMN